MLWGIMGEKEKGNIISFAFLMSNMPLWQVLKQIVDAASSDWDSPKKGSCPVQAAQQILLFFPVGLIQHVFSSS